MKLSVSGYDIEFGEAGRLLEAHLENKSYSSIFVVVDENTQEHCLPKVATFLPPHQVITITSGEEHKNLETAEIIWTALMQGQADRHSLVINLGGGVIGDMGGFVASTYMRGLDFIQVPTTLLSQVDASVGGKLGVDFKGLKNFIGLFNDPQCVVVDSSFIQTLPDEEVTSGYAEMVKHALIQDEKIWAQYIGSPDWKKNLTNSDLKASVDIKRNVVLEDPFEKGLRKILNFGHTLGHAIETYSFSTDAPLLHGYAIALGMIGEAWLSKELLDLPEQDFQKIKNYIHSVYQIDTSAYQDIDTILGHMKHDKKNKGGKVMFSLLTSIGDCGHDIEVNQELIKQSIKATLG